MEEDVKEILDKLGAPEDFRNLINLLYTNIVEKMFLVITGILILCFAFAYLVPLTRPYSGWLLIAAFLSILLYSLSSFLGQGKFLLTPIKSYISDLSTKINSERDVVKNLSMYSSRSINSAKERLEHEKEQIEGRIGFLLGVMDKLGLAPALITLYIAYAKAMNDPQLANVPDFVLALLAGLYLGAFFAKAITAKFSLMSVLLKQSYDIAVEREKFLITSSNDQLHQDTPK